MKLLKLFTSVLLLTFLASSLAFAVGTEVLNIAAPLALVALAVFFFGQKKEVGTANSVEVEIWENFIAENLFENHPWMLRSKDRGDRIITGPGGVQVVHIPQAGQKVNVVKNRSQYPIPVTVRNDTDVTYTLDKFSTDGMLLTEAEKYQLSYDKAMSLLNDAGFTTNDSIALELAHRWAATNATAVTGNIIRTTGASIAPYLDAQTGSKLGFLPADLAAAKTRINKQTKKSNRATNGLWAAMRYDAYNQLKANADVRDADQQAALGAVWEGSELKKLHGFDLFVDDSLPKYKTTASPVLKDLDEANGTTDLDAIFCFDESFIHRAVGTVKFYEKTDDALYQGDIYSAFVMAGGRQERADQAGTCSIVQING